MGLYYDPAEHNLTVIAEVETLGGYEWNGVVAWKHDDGRVLAGSDSVCSCYSPFEDCTESDLIHITDVGQLDSLLDGLYHAPTAAERQDFINAVRKAL